MPALARAGLVVTLLIGALVATACDSSGLPAVADGRVQVVASTDVWGSVVQAVGGNHVDVTSIIHGAGQDPHDYQSAPLDAARIGSASLTVYNGDGYDDFFPADLSATPAAHRLTVVAFDLSGRSGSSNEHLFYDLPTVRKVADSVAVSLGRLQPVHAAEFARNARSFDSGLDRLVGMLRGIQVAHPGVGVVVTEPVADYLLSLAGIADVTPLAFERAVESDTDTPVAALSATIDVIDGGRVSALVNNAQTETAVTGQLISTARAAGVPVVDVTETLPDGVTGYLAWMTGQVEALAAAVSR
jgi:zinc/manganese transport system substrate-binding protein